MQKCKHKVKEFGCNVYNPTLLHTFVQRLEPSISKLSRQSCFNQRDAVMFLPTLSGRLFCLAMSHIKNKTV
jgi:hypothetical protein